MYFDSIDENFATEHVISITASAFDVTVEPGEEEIEIKTSIRRNR